MADMNFLEDLAEPVSNDQLRAEDRAKAKQPKKAAPAPEPDAFFDDAKPEATEPPPLPAVVMKMRAIFGIESVAVTLVPIYRQDEPEPIATVGLRMISRHDQEWVGKTFARIVEGRHVRSLFDTLTVAAAIATLDMGPVADVAHATPVWKALDVKPESKVLVQNPLYPHASIRAETAELMFQILDDSMAEFVATLVEAYTALPTVGRTKPTPVEGKKENPTTRGS
jgi:hypothetical protein